MTDREIWQALTEFARRVGLLGDEERLAAEPVPATEQDTPCLAFGTYGQVRLCCTEPRGHAGEHSWQRAMVGKSACVAVARQLSFGADVVMCERPTHHAGEHAAAGADGVRWTWGDTARIPLCHAVDGCIHEAGHRGDHETLKLCRSHSPRAGNGAYFTCVLLKGHEGEHRSITALGPKTWRDTATTGLVYAANKAREAAAKDFLRGLVEQVVETEWRDSVPDLTEPRAS